MLEDIVREAVRPHGEMISGLPAILRPASERTVIVTSVADDGEVRPWLEVLRACPESTVLAVEGRGETASLFELWPRRRSLGALTRERISSAVQAATPLEQRSTIESALDDSSKSP
jgi:hypothetical protein